MYFTKFDAVAVDVV